MPRQQRVYFSAKKERQAARQLKQLELAAAKKAAKLEAIKAAIYVSERMAP